MARPLRLPFTEGKEGASLSSAFHDCAEAQVEGYSREASDRLVVHRTSVTPGE
jgi:hypothetical protein